MQQLSLFSTEHNRPFNVPFPSTRYQGSKRSLANWIWENVSHLQFDTVLDVFSGTGAVSHMFKNAGKQVTCNDLLAFNHQIGLALIENSQITLTDDDVAVVLEERHGVRYPDFIQRTFQGIYYTDEENAWLDRVVYNIDHHLDHPIRQALARFALFQACMVKRPYNLFHRANLYMRTAEVTRSFGNKATWDTPFETHFRVFITEVNQAVFDNGRRNQALQCDALETPAGADLVYLDPPYVNSRGSGVDYRDFYHFLEGLVSYSEWGTRLDIRSKHRRLQPQRSPWSHSASIAHAFEQVIKRHQGSIIVVSYRDDGIPSKAQLIDLLSRYKKQVDEAAQPRQYALAHKQSHELLLIAI
jgi:adenine-specific DNA methylase